MAWGRGQGHFPGPEEREAWSSWPLLRDQLCLVLPSVLHVQAELEVTSKHYVPSDRGKFHEPSTTVLPRCAYAASRNSHLRSNFQVRIAGSS